MRHAGSVASLKIGPVGEYIREQRRTAQYSLRQLADMAGVSNPYLSQIERGLRKPSAEILQQIARGLRIASETLYVRAGILDDRAGDQHVSAAIFGDAELTDRQKAVLIDIYESFRRENALSGAGADPTADVPRPDTADATSDGAPSTRTTTAGSRSGRTKTTTTATRSTRERVRRAADTDDSEPPQEPQGGRPRRTGSGRARGDGRPRGDAAES
jgi:transcriptional regulator with XRE-family HTH domain